MAATFVAMAASGIVFSGRNIPNAALQQRTGVAGTNVASRMISRDVSSSARVALGLVPLPNCCATEPRVRRLQMSDEYESRSPAAALFGKLLPGSRCAHAALGIRHGDFVGIGVTAWNRVQGMPDFSPRQTKSSDSNNDFLGKIDWAAPKQTGLAIEDMCSRLDAGIREREWFVTGRVLPELFSDDFRFQDPDVSLDGIEMYARQVNRLFDQKTARVEVVNCRVVEADKVCVIWRLSGCVNLGPAGIDIKPYVVTTDLNVGEDGLINFQEDRFDLPGWDILLSAFFPFLRPLLKPEAPPVEVLRQQFASADGA